MIWMTTLAEPLTAPVPSTTSRATVCAPTDGIRACTRGPLPTTTPSDLQTSAESGMSPGDTIQACPRSSTLPCAEYVLPVTGETIPTFVDTSETRSSCATTCFRFAESVMLAETTCFPDAMPGATAMAPGK